MKRLTTHVLDTMHGRPAQGMLVDLRLFHGDHMLVVSHGRTDADGRLEKPLLDQADFQLGEFELHFYVGQFFEGVGVKLENPFLSVVPIRFTISEHKHYHVPLLVSPFAYSTYRGS